MFLSKWIAVLILLLTLFPMIGSSSEKFHPRVVVETEFGKIQIEVFIQEAPVTSNNFLRYVDEGRFEGAAFYRVVHLDNQPENDVKIEVIQGGLGFEEQRGALPPIGHETTEATGILHRDGVVSMARDQPGTAGSELFICIGEQPELDFGGRRNPDGQGFAAFGRVVSGMEVVRRIQRLPSTFQMLDQEVAISAVYRLK
jgi:peptidyl-prolyl cis-trans isomerase A (cyclophilin A)